MPINKGKYIGIGTSIIMYNCIYLKDVMQMYSILAYLD